MGSALQITIAREVILGLPLHIYEDHVVHYIQNFLGANSQNEHFHMLVFKGNSFDVLLPNYYK